MRAWRWLLSILLFGISAVIGAATCTPPAAALVSWYAGEGDASDVKNLNNGTLVGGAGFAAGLVGQAFSFNGAGQYVSIADSASLRPASVTVEAWVNPSVLNSIGHIVAKQNGGGSCDSYVLWLTSGQLHGAVCDSASSGTQIDGPTLPANTWTHVALTYDQANRATTLYVNGAQVARNGGSVGSLNYDASPVLIGADNQGGGITDFFAGLIDEPAIYDRALGAGEINAIYQAGAAGKCRTQTCVAAPPGVLAWYKGENSTSDFQGGHSASAPNGVSYVAGEVGQAFSFAGNQYLVAADNPAVHGPSYTVGGWFRLDSSGGVQCFVCKPVGPGTSDSFALFASGGTLYFAASTAASDHSASTGVAPAVGQWFHFAETYDAATQTATAYVNGVASGTINTAVEFDGQPLYIGADTDNGPPQTFLNGAADEVQVYNRALSPTEIAAIYNAGGNGQCAGCVALQGPPSTWIKGEGDASDSSGNGNNGTLAGGANFAPGIVGQALNLSGNLQYVNLGDSASLRPSSLTIDAWVNLNFVSFTTQHVVARQVNGSFYNSYVLYTVNGQLNAFVGDAGNNPSTLTGPNLPLNSWHHVAFTYDQATRQQVMYVDGQVVASNTTGVSAIAYDSSPTLIGADNEGNGITDFWDGQIDEVQIFPRALSPAEINGIYCGGARGTCATVKPLTFAAVTGAELNTVYTSNTQSINDLAAGVKVPVSISGGQYSQNGGPFTSVAGMAGNGDTFVVQVTSSGSYSTKTYASLTVGKDRGSFSVITRKADTVPTAFSFHPLSNAALSTLYTSNSISVSGLDNGVSSPVSIAGGQYSVNGGAYTSAAGSVVNGDSVTVQATSSAMPATTVTAMLTIGGVHGNYAVKTRMADLTPDSMVFPPVGGADLGTVYTSNTVTISGLDAGVSAPVSVSGGLCSINGGAFTAAAGAVQNGDTVALQVTSSASLKTRVAATLHVGAGNGIFAVTTKAH